MNDVDRSGVVYVSEDFSIKIDSKVQVLVVVFAIKVVEKNLNFSNLINNTEKDRAKSRVAGV